MPAWLHRTSKQYLTSTSPASLSEPEANYIQDPNMAPIAGFPSRYWVITGDIVSLMSQAERDVVDAAALVARRDALADEISKLESYSRAFALIMLDEFNSISLKINEILDAIDAGSNANQIKSNIAAVADRPQRTAAQLRAALRNRLDT